MKKIALCIGNDNYNYFTKLDCAVNDAKCVADALTELGFETIFYYNLDRRQMCNVIADYTEKISEYDSCVFYYAGHGCQIDGENILIPIDLEKYGNKVKIKDNAYPLENLMEALEKYPDKTKVFIFDACRTVINSRGGNKGFAPVRAPQGSIIAFSTSPGQASGEDLELKHGYYTDSLLQYIKLPRVSIETVFKKTRERLVAKSGHQQIPWEHTSLIGDYFLNPNTIYDGISYSPDALADSRYHASEEDVGHIIKELKSCNWYKQGPALLGISTLDFGVVSASDLFVIGRNIYQAAVGSCFSAQEYIDNFSDKDIPDEAKLHLLNGIAYEIYFTSNNNLRIYPKTGYYKPVIKLLEEKEYYGSRMFISSVLCKIEDQVIYILGQNEIMEFVAEIDAMDELQSLTYKGTNVLFDDEGKKYNSNEIFTFPTSKEELIDRIARQVAAPNDCINVTGVEKGSVSIPSYFTIRKAAIGDSEE